MKMNSCRNLKIHLARGDDAATGAAFERHLAACAACRGQLERWRAATAAIAEGASALAAARPVTADERRALLARARGAPRERREASRPIFFRVAVPIALAAMAAVVATAVWLRGRDASPEVAAVSRPVESALRVIAAGPGEGGNVERAGPARLVLAPGSRLVVEDESADAAAVTLVRGRVAVEVEGREDGEVFAVAAGPLRIHVVGTVFAVSRDGVHVRVEVAEGRVEVSRDDGSQWRVPAGRKIGVAPRGTAILEDLSAGEIAGVLALFGRERLAQAGEAAGREADLDEPDGRAVEGQAPSLAGTVREEGGNVLEQLRGLVASGQFVEAEGRLVEHLERHPQDTAAWSLLADCRRKSGRYQDAVVAYLELIDRAVGAEADLARYKAGVILQDNLGDHLAAVMFLDEFLVGAAGETLAPDAMLRAARSHAVLGDEPRARALLEQVVDRHAGHRAAAAARRLLEQSEPAAEGARRPAQPNE